MNTAIKTVSFIIIYTHLYYTLTRIIHRCLVFYRLIDRTARQQFL